MKTYQGSFVQPLTQQGNPVTLVLLKEHIRLGYTDANGLHQTILKKYKELDFKYHCGEQATLLSFTGTDKIQIAIAQNISADIQLFVAADNRNWMAKTFSSFRIKMVLFFVFCIALLWGLYISLVPYLSQQLAGKLPRSYEISLGNKMFAAMVNNEKKDVAKTALLNSYWTALQIPTQYPVQLTVLNDPTVNAYAIMGGNIVVYTGLLNQLKNHEALAALICHEFVHVQNRHTTKSIFRSLGSSVFLSLLFGRMGNLTNVVLQQTNQFSGLQYSRKLEKEADIDGLAILRLKQIDAHGFVDLFTVLEKNSGAANLPEILSSHPDLKERMAYIHSSKNYSNQKDPILNAQLENIFLQLQHPQASADF